MAFYYFPTFYSSNNLAFLRNKHLYVAILFSRTGLHFYYTVRGSSQTSMHLRYLINQFENMFSYYLWKQGLTQKYAIHLDRELIVLY